MLFGTAVALLLLGVSIRSWAAGTIRKNSELATSGAYGLCRHPLYLGSFLMIAGACLGTQPLINFPIVAPCVCVIYVCAIRSEEARLAQLFGKEWQDYLSENEACRLLHAPDDTTVIGIRDHAILFAYFKTACRFAAISSARVGDLERTDTDWFIVVREKGKKQRRLPLLEAAGPVLRWLEVAEIDFDDPEHPLFCPLERDRRTPKRRALSQQSMLEIVKRHATAIGLDVSRLGRRGICTHSLRKTALNNALEHGAKVEEVQQWAGHADIRTTQEYIQYGEKDAETAARRCQIR